MNIQKSKKELEILIMQYFSSVFEDFPKGKIESSESPDFIINLSTRNKLGIELTRLYPNKNIIATTSEKALWKSNTEIVDLAHEMFCRNSAFTLFVKILFAETAIAAETTKNKLAKAIAVSVNNAVEKCNSKAFFTLSISGGQLPSEIERILIVNHPVMNASVWERANIRGVSNDVVADISSAIQKKDEKLRIYHRKKLNLYWLIITTDRLHGVKNFNLPQQIANREFSSRFQRVFLFDLLKSKIYQIV